MTEFLGIPLFDDDFYKLLFRFAMNMVFLTLIIRWLYFSSSRRKDYLFTYYMIGIIVFFICFTLKKFELDLGMALGLFAIFGILRYRTNTIAIKEMTYLFIVIGVSVINALANSKMSYSEILLVNVMVVLFLYLLERMWLIKTFDPSKTIIYDNMENVKPENLSLLKADIAERTGLEVIDVTIGNIDYIQKVAKIRFTYKQTDK